MKKFILILILIAGAHQLRAQQILQQKPFDTLANSSKLNSYLNPGTSLKQLQIGPDLTAMVKQSNFNALQINNLPIDNMPIAVLAGNSKMPVARLSGNSKMPVANVNHKGQNLFPGDMVTKFPGAVIAPVQKK